MSSSSSRSPSVGKVERWLCGLPRSSKWRRSGPPSESSSEQDSFSNSLSPSDSLLEWMCPPLPGQVPMEPAESLSAQGPLEAPPENKSSTECKKKKGFGRLLKSAWKVVTLPFRGCYSSHAVDDPEPFVPPADPETFVPPADPELFVPPADPETFVPPADPEPFVPPADPEPFVPPTDPEPFVPPADPEPFVPPADPEPFVPPTDPEPFVPPTDPEPFVPPTDPEPFVPPADPEPSSPVPDGVETNNDSFESLYTTGGMIGSGGFGRVYEGTRKFDGKKVAIKRMFKDNDFYLDVPGHPKPLVTEVALLLLMRKEPISPFVVQLYDWFEHPRKFTLVMEYPEPCQSLLDFIILNPQLDEATARLIMRQAVLSVQHCIEHGVFHNDVHAHNFLLKKDTLELKLIDFGCGQLLSADGYESDVYQGLQDYCPPEVFTEARFHAVPANVWALGVLLYEMVNACPPFHDTTEIKQAKVIFKNSSLSKECSDLIGQCLTLDPTKRPTLEQILQHQWITNDQL